MKMFENWSKFDKSNALLALFLASALIVNASFLFVINMHVSRIEDNLAFDIDKARDEYMSKGLLMFMRGCDIGTDYPPEYRTYTGAFNPHATIMYCQEKSKFAEEYLSSELMTFARRESKK